MQVILDAADVEEHALLGPPDSTDIWVKTLADFGRDPRRGPSWRRRREAAFGSMCLASRTLRPFGAMK